MRKTVLKTVAGFAVALGIIGLFTWQVGWGNILRDLSRLHPAYATAGFITAFAGMLLLGITWWVAVRGVAGIGLLHGIRVFFITYFANGLTPLGQFGGEPFIAYILSKDADIPVEEALGAVIVADILNTVPFFTMSLLGILVFLTVAPMSEFIALILKLIIALTVGTVAVIGGIALNRDRAIAGLHRVGELLGRMASRLRIALLDGVSGDELAEKGRAFFAIIDDLLQQKRMLATALVTSHFSAIAGPVAVYLFLRALGVPDPVFAALLFIVPASMLAGFLPLPGGLGGIEAAMAALLTTIIAIPASAASASVLLWRFVTYWLGLVIGGYFASHFSVNVLAEQFAS